MELMENDLNASLTRGKARSYETKNTTVEQKIPVTVDTDAQDEHLWERAFAESQDVLELLGARSRENRKAGRTKRISA